MLISVICPVYNSEKTLGDLFKSISRQKVDGYEFIFVNDASTDRSREMLDEFVNNNSFCRAIHNPETEWSGVSYARNCGLKEAKGDYIIFVDSDDEFYDNALVEIKKTIQNQKYDIYIFNYMQLKNNLSSGKVIQLPQGEYKSKEALSYLFDNKQLCGFVWNKAFRKEVIEGLSFDQEIHMAEDLLFCVEALLRTDKVYFKDKVTHVYCYYPNSLSNSYSSAKMSTFKMYEKVESMLPMHEYPFIRQVLSCAKVNFSKYLLEYYYKNFKDLYAKNKKFLKKTIKTNIKAFNCAPTTTIKARLSAFLTLHSTPLAVLLRR